MESKRNGTLYVGVTLDLVKRVDQHKESWVEGFTQKYGAYQLVYYQHHDTVERKKRIKNWRRQWKPALIEKATPNRIELYTQIAGSRVKHGMTGE